MKEQKKPKGRRAINIDDNAYVMLLKSKEYLQEKGITNPTFSDAIRNLGTLAGVKI